MLPNRKYIKTSWVRRSSRPTSSPPSPSLSTLVLSTHSPLMCNEIYIAARKLQTHCGKQVLYLAASVVVCCCLCISVCLSVRTTDKPLIRKAILASVCILQADIVHKSHEPALLPIAATTRYSNDWLLKLHMMNAVWKQQFDITATTQVH